MTSWFKLFSVTLAFSGFASLLLVANGEATPTHVWSRSYGNSGIQIGHSSEVATDPAGNVLVTGRFFGTVNFGGGPLTSAGDEDIYLAKVDALGNHVWSKRFGDALPQGGGMISCDASGNVVLGAGFAGAVDFGGGSLVSAGSNDIALAKFDASGNHVWSKRFGDASSQSVALANGAAGNVLITGSFLGTVDFGGGPLVSAGSNDIYLAKFDGSGNHVWSKRFGDASSQSAISLASDSSGDVLITGPFQGTVNFGGGPLVSAGTNDIFLAKFDALGNHLWSKRFGDASSQDARSVAIDASGNVLLGGWFLGGVDFGGGLLVSAGTEDIFLAKFDVSGNHVWSKRFGDAASQGLYGLAFDPSGNALCTGSNSGTVNFGGGPLSSAGQNDIFLARFDALGNFVWSQQFGGTSNEWGNSVASDHAGNVVLHGSFASGSINFGGGQLLGQGSYDLFLAKFSSIQATIAPGPSLSEGNAGLTPFNFTVNLSAPAPSAVTVNYETSDGTATVAGNDYQPATSSIVIPAMATSGSITVNVVGDTEFESDETFNVTITSVTGGANLGSPASATGVIVNEDPTFTDIEAGLPGVIYGSAAWGDYDSDGDLDLLLTGQSNSNVAISNVYRNDGGSFIDLALGLPGVASSSVAWGDYDNDGDLDFVLTGVAYGFGRISRVYRNDAGSFTDIAAGLPSVNIGSVAWGDYDNDGDLDLLLAGRADSGYISRVYRNNSGIFTDIVAGLPGVFECSVAWGDFDNDGDLDLVLAGHTGTGTISRVYRNDAGTFSDHMAGLPGVWTSSVAWGDFDNDGDLDLALAGINNDDVFAAHVYRNNSGTFVDHGAGLQGVGSSSVAWGDYDNDGDLDLALMGFTGTGFTRVYRNDSGTFVGLALGLQGAYSGSVAWGDYDNDGDLDLLLHGKPGSGPHITRVYRNDGAPMNAPPTVPGNLTSNVVGNQLTLSWDASTDTQTPAAGLSYNLRVGTTTGGNELTAAMAANANGYRRVVRLGNAQKRTSWTVSLSTGGSYFWSVQAIDTGFEGSPFATELVVNPPQVSLAAGPSVNEGDSGLTPFIFTVNLSRPSPVPVTVNYQTGDNTATTANNDYQPATSSIVIPAASLSGVITVNGVGDYAVEADETFSVTLTSVTGGAVLGASVTATGTILNDDVSCGVAFSDGTFNDADWTLTMQTVGFTFGAGVGGSQVASGGNPGQYRSALSQPGCCTGHTEAWGFNLRSGAFYDPAVQGPIISISYSEDFISFQVNGCQPQETGPALSQGGQLYFYAPFPWSPSRCFVWTHLSREGITALDFRTVASASAHPDFSAGGGPIQFGYVRGSLADNGSYAANAGIDNWNLVINPPQVVLAAGPSVNEGNSGLTPFNFTVNLSCPSPVPVTVNYQTGDNTATTANNDYQPATSSIVIPAASLSGVITVNGVGDYAVEADETFSVTITSVTGGAVLGAPVTATGTILNEDAVSGVDGDVPAGAFALKFNEPNPFTSSTRIGYSVPVNEHVLLRVFDLSGHLVKTLVNRYVAPGNDSVHWDGTNENGEVVPAGMYFYRLQAGSFQKTRGMLLLK